MNAERAREIAAVRAEAPPLGGGVCWLRDEDGEDLQKDFCRDCATALPMLGGLLALHLLTLAGIDLPPSPAEDWKYDRSWGCHLAKQVQEARDGGWCMEEDGPRWCEHCGIRLEVSFTDYAVRSELGHWQEHGPPDGGEDWWSFLEMLDALGGDDDKRWPLVFALLEKWGLS